MPIDSVYKALDASKTQSSLTTSTNPPVKVPSLTYRAEFSLIYVEWSISAEFCFCIERNVFLVNSIDDERRLSSA